MSSLASYFKFQELCDVLELISKAKLLKEKKDIFSTFIQKFNAKGSEIEDKTFDTSFFPVLRLIVPQLDRDRGAYGLKEFSLAKKFIKMLSLPPDGPDAACLLNYRATARSSKVKNFADAAYWILQKHFYKSTDLNIIEINEYLSLLASKHSSGDPRGVEETLFKLFRLTSAKEQKWLIKIILKEMDLGIGHDSLLNTFHPDGAEFYATNVSLSKVCDVLKSSIRLHEIEITLFLPFRPMLSQRCDLKEFTRACTGKIKYYVETKFDGERFQLHMKDNVFKYFSRNGFDYTHTFGDTFDSGIYTPLLKHAFKENVSSIILDGEMMGWNTKTKEFGSKGMNFDVKNLKDSSTHQPCLCVFDILLLNDEVLTNKPLKQRMQYLRDSIKPIEGVILISKVEEATSQKDIVDALNRSMDRKEEGIVFKNPNSLYKANSRNAGWWKMKLEYFEGVMNDLDVIIVGGYYGKGRHRLNIHHYLIGVAAAVPEGETPDTFLSFGKVQSGLSDEEFDVLDKRLTPFWRKMTEGDPEAHGLKFGKEKPDLWISPADSCVLLVRATELIHSSDFKTKYTLRFPRIQEIREDKGYYDCLTDAQLEDLFLGSKAVAKLSKRHLELSDLEVLIKKRKQTANLKPKEVGDVEVKTNLLNGYEFSVLNGNDQLTKEQVEQMIVQNGGTVVQSEGSNTFCILAGSSHPRINYCKQSKFPFDIVNIKWLLEIIQTGKFRNYGPFNVMYASKKTANRLLSEYDQYGDSYTEEATEESLEQSLKLIEHMGDYINLMPEEIEDLFNQIAHY